MISGKCQQESRGLSMTKNEGTFIVLEGTDGSGKGTQYELLRDWLIQAGHDVTVFDFPQYDSDSSYFVKEYLNGHYGTANEVGPYTGSLFFSLDRYDAANRIRQALDDGKVVLANRFTGSNMAHQGTKFDNVELRRGYFIWLDNLEFETLKIPRPDMSFVLRVPAEVAQSLVDKKQPRSYTDKKRDIHEADLNHLKKSVEVYDDLCQLFPKDFTRIDCVRSDELLTIEQVHKLLLEKVRPLLPKPTRSGNSYELAVKDDVGTKTDQTHGADKAQLGSVTSLLSADLPVCADINLLAMDDNDEFYAPDRLAADIKKRYDQVMQQLLELKSNLADKLTTYVRSRSDVSVAQRGEKWHSQTRLLALAAVNLLSPLACLNKLELPSDKALLTKAVNALKLAELDEASAVGQSIIDFVRKTDASFLLSAPDNAAQHANAILEELAQQLLPNVLSDSSQAVTLTSAMPRNELDLVAEVLYSRSDLPLDEIKRASDRLPYVKKASTLEVYRQLRTGSSLIRDDVLGKANYRFDLISSFASYHQLKQYFTFTTSQSLSPRYGYDMPPLIEQADLSEDFMTAFDLSLQLYSQMQAAGFAEQAQYAALNGHKLRWQLNFSASELLSLLSRLDELQLGVDSVKLLKAMVNKLAEVHPLLWG